jgi:hypothetical protein
MTVGQPKLDLLALEWAIEQRSKIQQTILALYKYAKSQPLEGPGFPASYLLDHLSAASFALWRAAFLTDGSRDPFSVHEEQTNFLATVLNTNAINFSDDRKYQAWAVSFYLENAKNRLAYAVTIADEYMNGNVHATVMPMLRLRGTSNEEKGKGDRALTRYEWECAHRALRILLKILDPTCNLAIENPKMPPENKD